MSEHEGTWYELRPGGRRADGAERYGDRAAAEQAATALLIRQPELPFVEVAECEAGDGDASRDTTVSRIAGAQPPAPSEAEIDDLHRLPRGDPEL